MTATTKPRSSDIEVLVVGGGPVGLILAGLLGAGGVRTLVVEQHPTTSTEAKAISVDDESLRVLQRARLDHDVYAIIQQGTGTRYFGADGRLLVHAKGRGQNRLGHPFKSAFAQPDFERVLLEAVRRLPCVEVRLSTELIGMTGLSALDDGEGRGGDGTVSSDLRHADGTSTTITSRFVVGCDGGRSAVRRELGIAMVGRSFDDEWLVVDTVADKHRERYAMHHGDPFRPHVIVPGRDGRCRYEMKLRTGEHGPGGATPEELALRLVGTHRQLSIAEIERCTTYRFHALVAERWRQGRAFVAGDAAHMMPPFAGQGLNSGIRDADNLSWKLAAVLQGRAARSLLDTYEQERRPHAQAMADLSVRLGRVMMTSSRSVAALRDAAVRAAVRVPPLRQYLAEARFKPSAVYRRGFVAVPTQAARVGSAGRRGRPPGRPGRSSAGLVGRVLPQPRVLTAGGRVTLLDDVLGPGFAVVGVDCPQEAWRSVRASELSTLGCRQVAVALDDLAPADADGLRGVADADGHLEQLFAPYRGKLLLVRPDRYVAAAWQPSELDGVLAALRPYLAAPTLTCARVDAYGTKNTFLLTTDRHR